MQTDPLPRDPFLRRQFADSDALETMELPPAEELQRLTVELGQALETGKAPTTRAAGRRMLKFLADFYDVSTPGLTVLGARPHEVFEGALSYELFGDYTPSTEVIRVWMRTAVLGKVTSHRGLLNTLLHEFCHHLDIAALQFHDTPHTRGFYARVDELYHLALATPPDERKKLAWIRTRGGWRIDWNKIRPTRKARR